ncbi:MAG TPA: response regulator [Alphaproteobacteria bacterium]|nr:response regulator [Alphaproteobacteria bacterium]
MARILIAEDEDALAAFCERVLREAGHHTAAVANGAEALRALDLARFDLVIGDIRMPVMDGISMALKLEQDHPAVRILLMTGFEAEKTRAGGMEGLVHGILSKPFTKADLLAAVAETLEP